MHTRRNGRTSLIPAQACQHRLKLIFAIWSKQNDVIVHVRLSAPKRAANPLRNYGSGNLLHVNIAVPGAG
jgi:hypothetical protein